MPTGRKAASRGTDGPVWEGRGLWRKELLFSNLIQEQGWNEVDMVRANQLAGWRGPCVAHWPCWECLPALGFWAGGRRSPILLETWPAPQALR